MESMVNSLEQNHGPVPFLLFITLPEIFHIAQMVILFLITDVISYMKQYTSLNPGFTSTLYMHVMSNNMTDTLSVLTELSNFTTIRKRCCSLQVELGPGGTELSETAEQEDEERRALDKRKYSALSRRCKEIEQVCS